MKTFTQLLPFVRHDEVSVFRTRLLGAKIAQAMRSQRRSTP